jgi:hypothetical protein
VVRSPFDTLAGQLPVSPNTRSSAGPLLIALAGLRRTAGFDAKTAGFVFSSRGGSRKALRLTAFKEAELCSFIDSCAAPVGSGSRWEDDFDFCTKDAPSEIPRFIKYFSQEGVRDTVICEGNRTAVPSKTRISHLTTSHFVRMAGH